MTRPDIGLETLYWSHNTDAPGRERDQQIASAKNDEAKQEARRRTSALTWLSKYLKRGRKR